jgi:hypothetical protein
MAPGSYLILSHACDEPDARHAEQILRLYNRTTSPMVMRERDELRAFFGDWTMLEPGVTTAGAWRPERGHPAGVAGTANLVGVAIKP